MSNEFLCRTFTALNRLDNKGIMSVLIPDYVIYSVYAKVWNTKKLKASFRFAELENAIN